MDSDVVGAGCGWYRTYLRCSGCRPGHHANKVSLCGYVPPQISCTLYMHRCTPVESPRGKVALWHTNAPGNLPRPGPNSSGALVDQPFHPHHCSTSQIVSTRQNGPTIRDLQYRNSGSISPQSAAEPSLCRRNRCTETDSPGVATALVCRGAHTSGITASMNDLHACASVSYVQGGWAEQETSPSEDGRLRYTAMTA